MGKAVKLANMGSSLVSSNFSISKDLAVSSDNFGLKRSFKLTSKSLLDIYNALEDCSSIPLGANSKSYDGTFSEKIRRKIRVNWVKKPMLVETEQEQSAFGHMFVTSTKDFNIYIRRDSRFDILIFEFIGKTYNCFSVFGVDSRGRELGIEGVCSYVRDEVIKAMGGKA